VKDYIFRVEIQGAEDTIKTFAHNAMDDIISLEGISTIYDCLCEQDEIKYLLNIDDVKELRDQRSKSDSQEMKKALSSLKDSEVFAKAYASLDS
jgi:glucokinase